MPSVTPARPKFIANVTTRDGTFDRVAMMPLISPAPTPTASPAMIPTHTDAPKVPDTIAIVIDEAASTDPTDTSSSPEIISSPTGTAMITRLAATFIHDAAPPADRNFDPPATANTMNTSTVPASAPVSGRLTKPKPDGDFSVFFSVVTRFDI